MPPAVDAAIEGLTPLAIRADPADHAGAYVLLASRTDGRLLTVQSSRRTQGWAFADCGARAEEIDSTRIQTQFRLDNGTFNESSQCPPLTSRQGVLHPMRPRFPDLSPTYSIPSMMLVSDSKDQKSDCLHDK